MISAIILSSGGVIGALLELLILGLVFWLIFYFAGKMTSGVPLQVLGGILAILFVLIALRSLGYA